MAVKTCSHTKQIKARSFGLLTLENSFVGHSYGGYIARIFADRYSDDVIGVVLIESAHELQFEKLPRIVNALIEKSKHDYKSRSREARMGRLAEENFRAPSSLPEKLHGWYRVGRGRPEFYEAFYGELELLRLTTEQIQAAKDLGEKPLRVVTARKSFDFYRRIPNFPVDEGNKIWLELQADLARLSKTSKHIFSDQANHSIHSTDPAIVVQAIKDIVNQLSSTPPGNE